MEEGLQSKDGGEDFEATRKNRVLWKKPPEAADWSIVMLTCSRGPMETGRVAGESEENQSQKGQKKVRTRAAVLDLVKK